MGNGKWEMGDKRSDLETGLKFEGEEEGNCWEGEE